MRHRKSSQRLSRPIGSRRATLRNLVINLLRHQRIKTTVRKARLTQSWLEHLISLGKQNSLQSRRGAYKILDDRIAVNELFSRIIPLFKNRTSGFSRIIRYSRRHGDGAELVFLELTEKVPQVKPREKSKEKLIKDTGVVSERPEKPKPEIKPEQKLRPSIEKAKPLKKLKSKPRKFLGGLRRLFKKERDSL